jgi:glycosyl transferase family 25
MPTWPIYIISLADEIPRRAACTMTMEKWGLSFEFFDAVEGAHLSVADTAGFYDPNKNLKLFKRPLSAPEIACYMSHYALWKRVAESESPCAVVLEDDFDGEDALPTLLRDLARLDLSNRLVKLHSEKHVSGTPLADLAGGYQLIDPGSVPGYALGYVISREAAANLVAKALPFGRPVDMDLKHWWEFDISILVVRPPVLHIRKGRTKSAIESSRQSTKPNGAMGSISRLVRNLRYQFLYRFEFFRARYKIPPRK